MAKDKQTRKPNHRLQSYGVLIVIDLHTLRIRSITENIETLYFVAPSELLKRQLNHYFNSDTLFLLRKAVKERHEYINITEATFMPDGVNQYEVSLIYYCTESMLMVELEPLQNDNVSKYFSDIQKIHALFKQCDSHEQLFKAYLNIAAEVNQPDSVMLIKHQSDGVGKVIAQKKVRGEVNYLNCHIPLENANESRPEYYQIRPIRYIPDITYKSVALIQDNKNRKVEIERSLLRGVKPSHRRSVSQLGYQAALSIALVIENSVWGVVAFYYRKPRVTSIQQRNFLILLGNLLAFFIRDIELSDDKKQQRKLLKFIEILSKKEKTIDLQRWLELCHKLVDFDGYAYCRGDRVHVSNTAGLSLENVDAMIDHCCQSNKGGVTVLDEPTVKQITSRKRLAGFGRAMVISINQKPRMAIVLIRHASKKKRDWMIEGVYSSRLTDKSTVWSSYDIMAMSHIRRLIIDKMLQNALARKALRDALTGLYNRFLFDDTFAAWLEQCKLSKQSITLLMVDADHFKSVNDHYGHDVGDKVLKHLAKVLASSVRDEDLVCRYGGEEFVILMKNVPDTTVKSIAESLRKKIAKRKIRAGKKTLDPVTVSIGGYTAFPARKFEGAEQVLKKADKALYEAKEKGRNCAVLHGLKVRE